RPNPDLLATGFAARVHTRAEHTRPLRLRLSRTLNVHARPLRPKEPSHDVELNDSPHLTGRSQPYDAFPGEGVAVPVPGPTPQNLAHEPDGRGVHQGDVDEPGPGDHDVVDPAGVEQPRPQNISDLPGRPPGRAGELKGDVGGVVPAPSGPRRRDDDPLGRSHAQ